HLPWRFLQFLLLLLLGVSSAAQAQVNITLGSSLTPQGPNSSWLSPSGDFAFGFQPVEGNTSSYLLAVWFDKIPEKTVAWYAKSSQDTPVQVPSSSVLRLTADGLLSLRTPSDGEVWSPRVPGAAYARMLDTGDFRLFGADGKAKWETFDVPADTILPTQVLLVGQQDKVLRSRLIATDYANGRFLLAVQSDGNLVFYPIAEPTTKRIYFTTTNGTQVNITSAGGVSMGDFFNRATLDPDGVFRQYLYPKSRKARSVWSLQWTVVSSIPQNICQAIKETNAGSGACGFNSYCSFDGTQNQTTVCQCPEHYEFFDKERKYKGCRPDFEPQSCYLDEAAAVAKFEMTPINGVDWPLADYEEYSPIAVFRNELEKATSDFREVLGSGASGTVYKGQLQDEHATSIAVKKIGKLQQETEKEFMVEVQTIGQTFHKNLVKLLGFCNEGTDRLLVYEFMTNGSLNEFLFGDARPHWSLRVQVALGVARGLLYLHEECSTQIIHCDIKPQNILLDDNFMAKIADFGLAKLLRANQTQTYTGIRGTRGYVAPEWFKNIGITSKVDVYSFGVILLELVCCRRNVELEIADEERSILTYWANDCYRCGRIDLLVEGDDEANFNIKKAERFVAVALWCLQEEPTMRPTMLKVTQMLDGAVQIPTPPDPSSFISSLP
uniref:non-specific serine/threonine protein kinase n=1 Tax=Aegilops tauschii subsp. strangulata TaxID=200361 RepID=A0A453AE13_AEGTS